MSSVATLFVAQMQDYLGDPSRINTPGVAKGNWQWRLAPGVLSAELAEEIAEMTCRYGRA
jgi:4-alpha-glucanotransferase